MTTPTLGEIIVYPVKSLDPHDTIERVTVESDGGLSYDRAFALFDADGSYINGKNDRRIHRIRSWFDPKSGRLTLRDDRESDPDPEAFDIDDTAAIESWFEERLGEPVEVRRDDTGGFPDDTLASGPTLISRATIETVAGWFDDIEPAEMKRRLRPNLVIEDVPAFWEDRLYRDRETAVAVRIGECTFLGSNPCQRCAVPLRDPQTGVETPGFRETFVEKRKTTLPEWVDRSWYDHYFRLMVNTFVPQETTGRSLAVGDSVEILGERPYPT
ncbi:MAG: MOSC N-terminal beta barrel domain-containing protein [Natronomonas sp.]